MELNEYIKILGSIVNTHTKYSIDVDYISIENLILINHLTKFYNQLIIDISNNVITIEDSDLFLNKLNNYINNLKKEINFYTNKLVSSNGLLTEESDIIIQE